MAWMLFGLPGLAAIVAVAAWFRGRLAHFGSFPAQHVHYRQPGYYQALVRAHGLGTNNH